MQLHEAVALGLPEIDFTNGAWLYQRLDGSCGGCLAGAALFAQGERKMEDFITEALAKYWPWTKDWRYTGLIPHPVKKGLSYLVESLHVALLLTELADAYKIGNISSEQIIDFIRSIEPPQMCEVEQQSEREVLAYA